MFHKFFCKIFIVGLNEHVLEEGEENWALGHSHVHSQADKKMLLWGLFLAQQQSVCLVHARLWVQSLY